jgi:predicted ArsR family transcriptional regulator
VPRSKHATRDRILDFLRRRGASTVTQLARRFRISTVAVRQQLCALREEGFVLAGESRPSRGRPARAFSLTAAAERCFPDRSGPIAVEILEELEAAEGRQAVVRAFERRARRVAEQYRAAMEGKSLQEKARVLARLRDEEGYVAGLEPSGGPVPEVVERHCPISALAERWPEICRIEEDLFRKVLGVPVERVEHLLGGGRCCRYRVAGEV